MSINIGTLNSPGWCMCSLGNVTSSPLLIVAPGTTVVKYSSCAGLARSAAGSTPRTYLVSKLNPYNTSGGWLILTSVLQTSCASTRLSIDHYLVPGISKFGGLMEAF